MMAAASSSPTRLIASEPSSPTVTRTPLPHALSKPALPSSSSPCVLPTPGPSSALASTAKTPASAHARPSSPPTHGLAAFAPTSSPTAATSPDAYALRPAKRARLAGPAGGSPVTPLPAAPAKAKGKSKVKATAAAAAGGRKGSSAMAKMMSDGGSQMGCKMGSFKVQVPAAAATPAVRTPAPAGRKKAAAPRGTPGSETPSGGLKGFRHMPSATPIASRTVAKQPKLEEVKLASSSKRTLDQTGAGAGTGSAAPGSVGMAKVPSVLQPVPVAGPVSVGAEEVAPVSCGEVPWSRADDEVILRMNGVVRGEFVWIARAMRPVRFAEEVAQRHKQLTHPSMTRSLSYSGPSHATRPPPPSSSGMSKSLSHAPSTFSFHNAASSHRTPLAPHKPTTFVIPNPRHPSPSSTPPPPPPASLASHALALSSASLSRSYSCSALPPRQGLVHGQGQGQPRPLSASAPASGGRPMLPPLLASSSIMARGCSLGAGWGAGSGSGSGAVGPLRPMMAGRRGSVGGAGMVRLPSLREVMNEPWAGWKGAQGGVREGGPVAVAGRERASL